MLVTNLLLVFCVILNKSVDCQMLELSKEQNPRELPPF